MSARGWVAGVAGAVIVAWSGFLIHNLADLPGQSLLSPESLFPTLVWIGCLALWLIPATRLAGAWSMLAWAGLNAVGGALSVLPLPFLPFEPAQTVEHYGFHLLYFATQLPLIVLLVAWIRSRGRIAGAPGVRPPSVRVPPP
ncbi:hypothetical protein ABZ477_10325 [Microbacterium sp. NPDC019599]|uniref:hypothetical protein n=1 Tax=Microbacterium sp. NPDC019599 TaxID=3154690 RepID=UPI0033D2B6CA